MVKAAALALALAAPLAGCDFVLRLDEVPVPSNAAIAYVQGAFVAPTGTFTSAQATYSNLQAAGDLDVVIISWFSPGNVVGVTDLAGNTYRQAGNMTSTESIFYAANIHDSPAGTNQVTVTFDRPVDYPDLRILEYSGIEHDSPLDGANGAAGTGVDLTSSTIVTKHAYDVLVAGNMVEHGTVGQSPGYALRMITNDAQIAEDLVVTSAGTYEATVSQDLPGRWIMEVAAFKGAANAPPP